MSIDNQEQFLKELSELTMKYKIAIWGCGCCGSPWIREYNEPNVKYIVDERGRNLEPEDEAG